ncbi:MAG: N,N-dimethylformamidase [Hyphomicrobiaceae bacterium]|nr:N,N-dimethylformamidase [Hyphomicrobiaceae bacterium]
MIPLAAYADRLSVRPGQSISFHVANSTGQAVRARLVRVVSADPNPKGPGIRTEPVEAELKLEAEPDAWQVRPGSYAVVDDLPELGDNVSFAAIVMPTRQTPNRRQVLAARAGEFVLSVDSRGRLTGVVGEVEIAVAAPLPQDRWSLVWLVRDAGKSEIRIGWRHAGEGSATSLRANEATAPLTTPTAAATGTGQPLSLAARLTGSVATEHFNGRIENPGIWRRALGAADLAMLRAGGHVPGALAAWDFGREISSSRIVDTVATPHHGRLVNAPTRAVRSSRWTGREMSWRHAPEQYAAIHFHDDDIDDCGWPASYTWTVPAGTRSAQYALILEAGDAAENVPFFVVAEKGKPRADIAVLVSTFTYTIYGNHARPEWFSLPEWQQAWRDQAKAWHAYPHNPADHPEYGWSTYNNHTDGSGIAIASWHRPMFNLRLGYLTYPYPEIRASGLRHYPADSHLIAWLEAKGYSYELVSDWELHTEGVSALSGYRVVMTGSHPEYHTRETLDALEAYRDGGGRFMYLGGNGFYWKIAASPEKPGVIEIRRAEGGIRAWAAEPGEYYNQFDGEYGGMWRRNGRPPQHLCGVGFTAQGNFVSSHYRVTPEARASRASWILEGLDGETFGGHGLSGHGAAGFELDRTDKRLGTPAHAVVLACSEGHEPEAPWVLVPEERLTHITTWPGQKDDELIRADLTFFETPNNGAVFSTGSITFCGALPTNNFENDVSRLLGNVLDRFSDPTAVFDIPVADVK